MNPDPFSYFVHRTRRVGHDKAKELAKGLRGEVSYKKAQRVLMKHDLTIERKKLYNHTQKENTKNQKPQEELTLLLACLDQEDFRVEVYDVYTLNDASGC